MCQASGHRLKSAPSLGPCEVDLVVSHHLVATIGAKFLGNKTIKEVRRLDLNNANTSSFIVSWMLNRHTRRAPALRPQMFAKVNRVAVSISSVLVFPSKSFCFAEHLARSARRRVQAVTSRLRISLRMVLSHSRPNADFPLPRPESRYSLSPQAWWPSKRM